MESHVPVVGKKILDVGCGGGFLAEALAEKSARVTGIDPSEELIAVARAHAGENRLHVDYHVSTPEAWEGNAPYDMITCMDVLEHVPSPSRVVEACAGMLVRGGFVFFSTLNRSLTAFLCAIVGAEYALALLPRGTHQYSRFLTPAELSRQARAAGLQTIAITGIRYDLLRQTGRLHRDTRINYMMACARQ
jgi:2-polyprenyl-6-hydroxyphenyl methylase/3-demethylubiquinone-9 3-methyltransferase